MKNPFTLGFGKKPHTFISRATDIQQIIEDFDSESPATQSYLITGVRGAGKGSIRVHRACHARKNGARLRFKSDR